MKELTGQEQDVALVIAIRGGSESAFAKLYKKYESGIGFLSQTFFKDKIQAQDVCIELFQKVYEKINKKDDTTYDESKAKFNTWIYNLAKYYFIDQKRKDKVEVLSLESLSMQDEEGNETGYQLPSNSLNPEQEMINKERIITVRDIIDNIKPAHREIARLRFVEDLSYKEIEELTGKKMGTVKGILFRAVDEIKQSVSDSELERAPEMVEAI